MIRTQVGNFILVEENRNGWNQDVFKERYSDVLDKYDYIVGDWGYGQLRLRGFYENSNRKVPFEQKIATLDEYLQEYCNFGCAYFVLRRVKPGMELTEPYEEQPYPYRYHEELQVDDSDSFESANRLPMKEEKGGRHPKHRQEQRGSLQEREQNRKNERPNRQPRPEHKGKDARLERAAKNDRHQPRDRKPFQGGKNVRERTHPSQTPVKREEQQ